MLIYKKMQLLKDGKHLPEAGVLLTVLQEMGNKKVSGL